MVWILPLLRQTPLLTLDERDIVRPQPRKNQTCPPKWRFSDRLLPRGAKTGATQSRFVVNLLPAVGAVQCGRVLV